MIRRFVYTLSLALVTSSPALATQYVQNGNFSTTTATSSQQMSANNGSGQVVANWTSATSGSAAGYNFLVMGNAGTTQGGIQTNNYGGISLWGNNGFTSSAAIGGSGGNYIAADGAFDTSLIYQTISGLTVGQQYDLSFNWAGAQQYGFDGATSEAWNVYFGTSTSSYQSFSTGSVAIASHGFSGWQTANTTFTATGTTQILAFLAQGTPGGQPPFSLLDDVSLTEHVTAAVPEPATWAMMIGGFGMIGTALRRQRVKVTVA